MRVPKTAEVHVKLTFRRSAHEADRFDLHSKRFYGPGFKRVARDIPKELKRIALALHPDTIKARRTANELHLWIGAHRLSGEFFPNVARAMDAYVELVPAPKRRTRSKLARKLPSAIQKLNAAEPAPHRARRAAGTVGHAAEQVHRVRAVAHGSDCHRWVSLVRP